MFYKYYMSNIRYCSRLQIPWRRKWQPIPVLLPGKPHGQRSLVGCSPWGRYESDMTERLHFHFSLSCIGEGNGNPFQCSCLETPRDGGAWWAAVHGVAKSHTWLKWLSLHACMHLCFNVSAMYHHEEVTKFITKSTYHIMFYAYFQCFWENQSREIFYIQMYQITEARNPVELIFFKHGK